MWAFLLGFWGLGKFEVFSDRRYRNGIVAALMHPTVKDEKLSRGFPPCCVREKLKD